MEILGNLASITSSENHWKEQMRQPRKRFKDHGRKGLSFFSVIFAINIGYSLHAWLFRYWISGFMRGYFYLKLIMHVKNPIKRSSG